MRSGGCAPAPCPPARGPAQRRPPSACQRAAREQAEGAASEPSPSPPEQAFMPCSPRHDLCDHGLSSWVTPRGVPGGPTLAVPAGPLSGGPGAGGGAGWSGPPPLSPPASGGSLCPSSLQQPRSPQRGMCWRGGVLRGSLRSLGAVSSTVSFICHLITSVGHGSPPAWRCPADTLQCPYCGHGTCHKVSRPRQSLREGESTLAFLQPLSAASPPSLAHPSSLPHKQRLPGWRRTLAPATAGCSQGSHTSSSRGP